jgi:hypothetical protein
VSTDGTFEIRVPAGSWVVGFRRSPGAGTPELPPAELKVAVTAGGTVDVGTVQLAGPRTGTPQPEPLHDNPLP